MKHARETQAVKLSAPRKSIFATNFGITPFVLPPENTMPIPFNPSDLQTNPEEGSSGAGQDLEKGDLNRDEDQESLRSVDTFRSTEPLTSQMK